MRSFAKIVLVFIFFFFLFLSQEASAKVTADLGIRAEDISFSTWPLIAGSKTRIYAVIHNFGEEDMTGFVSFYQGTKLLGTPQFVSVKAKGFADEVFVDFIVPDSAFNILAMIQETDPPDENPENNQALTKLFYPLLDSDHDGIPDESDNCPLLANPDQKDSDQDKIGDLCDDDWDNDGLKNEEEIKRKTDPYNPDTDGDGLVDGADPFPLIPLSNEKTQEKTEQKPNLSLSSSGQKTKDNLSSLQDSLAKMQIVSQAKAFSSSSEEQNEQNENNLPLATSTKLKITNLNFQKLSWNQFSFQAEVLGGTPPFIWHWDFGDGQEFFGKNPKHRYKKNGTYTVRLILQDQKGEKTQTSTTLKISFFNFGNPLFLFSLLALSSFLAFLFFLNKKLGDEDHEEFFF